MSRGGRGGARGGGNLNTGGRMRGQPLPFNVDPELEEEVARERPQNFDYMHHELYPEIDLVAPTPPSLYERELVKNWRIRLARMQAGPFFTGRTGAFEASKGDPDMPGGFNPFEDAPTWSNGKRKRDPTLPDLRGVQNLYPQFFPKELRPFIEDMKNGGKDNGPKRARKLALPKKSVKDVLAKFDENGEEGDEAGAETDDADDDDPKPAEDGEDAVEAPQDDTYEEDEEDEANDYNAENYFDDGEDDQDGGFGGEEYDDGGY